MSKVNCQLFLKVAAEKIQKYLTRFAGLKPPEKTVRDAVIFVVEKELGEKLPPEKIFVRGPKVYLDCPSVLKSEIYFRKTKILSLLRETLGSLAPEDIR